MKRSKDALLDSKCDAIRLYDQYATMTGKGEEWRLDSQGQPIAVFIDGVLRCHVAYPFADKQGDIVTKILI